MMSEIAEESSVRSEPMSESRARFPQSMNFVNPSKLIVHSLVDKASGAKVIKIDLRRSFKSVAKFCPSRKRLLKQKPIVQPKEHVNSPEKYSFVTKSFPKTI